VMKEQGYSFDLAYTSVLKRANSHALDGDDEMDLLWIPVERDWRSMNGIMGRYRA